MARFQYNMQNILDIKVKLEDQAKSSYGEAKRKFEIQQEIYREIEAKKKFYEQKRKEIMTHQLIVSEMKYYENCVQVMKDIMKKQELFLEQAKLEVSRKEQEMQKAVMERKTQEILREKKLEQFMMELKQQEDKENDQLVSFKYNNSGEEA